MGRKLDIASLQNLLDAELDSYFESLETEGPIMLQEQYDFVLALGQVFLERENVRGMLYITCTPEGYVHNVEYEILEVGLAVEKRPRNVKGNFIDLVS
jgi:hypothetical protein